jgi:hypothetical protein
MTTPEHDFSNEDRMGLASGFGFSYINVFSSTRYRGERFDVLEHKKYSEFCVFVHLKKELVITTLD